MSLKKIQTIKKSKEKNMVQHGIKIGVKNMPKMKNIEKTNSMKEDNGVKTIQNGYLNTIKNMLKKIKS